MRTTTILLMMLLSTVAALSTGCSPVMTVQSLAGSETLVAEPALAGLWTDADNKAIYAILLNQDNIYRVVYNEGSDSQRFDMSLVKLNGQLVADLSPADPPFGTFAGHFYYAVTLNGNQVQLAALDSDWLREETKSAAIAKDTIVLDLGQVRKYLKDARSFGEVETLHRVGS